MRKLLRKTLVVVAIATATVSTTNAAFRVAKETTQVAIATNASTKSSTHEVLTNSASTKELKATLKTSSKGLRKSKIAAALLAFFLGSFGVHSFYMGQTSKGYAQLGGTVAGYGLVVAGLAGYVSGAGTAFPTLALIGILIVAGVSIWAFVDFIRILTGGLEPEDGFDS